MIRTESSARRTLADAGLPDLILPLLSESDLAAAAAAPAPCAAVTRQALQDLSDAIGTARQRAEANVAVNGEGVPAAVYPVAATYGRDHLVVAQDDMTQLLTWIDQFPPQAIHYSSVVYSIYGYCRQIIHQLHHARHWEAISAVYNARRGTAAVAVECIDLITAAIDLAEPVATNATTCYVLPYLAAAES